MRCQRQILNMGHAAGGAQTAGNATAVALYQPQQGEQQQQERHNRDDLIW